MKYQDIILTMITWLVMMEMANARLNIIATRPSIDGVKNLVKEEDKITVNNHNTDCPDAQRITYGIKTMSGVIMTKPIYHQCKSKEADEFIYNQLKERNAIEKRWNPVLTQFSLNLIGGSVVSGTITLGSVVGIGGIAIAAALVWKGISSITSFTETTANSPDKRWLHKLMIRGSEDIFVDVLQPDQADGHDPNRNISDEDDDPDSLEQNIAMQCAQDISDQAGSGGCCLADLYSDGDTTNDNTVLGLVENGIQLNC